MGKTINAKELLADINAGMTNTQLMNKYGISSNQVVQLKKQLAEKGLISQKKNPVKPHVKNDGSRKSPEKDAEEKKQPKLPILSDFRNHLKIRQERMKRTLIALGVLIVFPAFTSIVFTGYFHFGQFMPLLILCLIFTAVIFVYSLLMKNLMENGQVVNFKSPKIIMRPQLAGMSRKPGYLAKLLTFLPAVAVNYEFEFEGAKRNGFQLIYLDEEIITNEQKNNFLVVNSSKLRWHQCIICQPATSPSDISSESSEGNAFTLKGGLFSMKGPLYYVVLVASAFFGAKLVLDEPRGYVSSLVVGTVFAFGAAVIMAIIKYLLEKRGN